MKKIRIIIFFMSILTNFIILPGCWNYREINNLAIVTGIAIDKSTEVDGYHITFEIADFIGGGKETKIESKLIESDGKTIFDAVRNAIKFSPKKLYWSHAGIAILSQEVAREGILQTIDFINRDPEPREQMHILISKEKTAKVLFEQQETTKSIRGFEIEKMMTSRKSLSKVPEIQVHDIVNDLSTKGISLAIPIIAIATNQKEKMPELGGAALFSKDKLIGFLDEDETKFFQFVVNKIKGGVLPFKLNPKDPKDNITLEIYENKTKINPIYLNSKLSYNIDVRVKASIGEVDISKNVIDEKGQKLIKERAEKDLKMDIENVIKKVQQEYGADIFGFGITTKKEMPELWRSIEKDWDSIFKEMETDVHVEIEIQGSGMASKSIKIGD